MTQISVHQAMELAIAHHRAGRLREAEDIYRRVIAGLPQHAEALHLLSLVAWQSGRWSDAVDAARHAATLRPDDVAFRCTLAQALTSLGLMEEAIAAYREALRLRPDYAEVHNNLGNLLRDRGQREAAMDCYRQALHSKPDYAEAHNNLCMALRDAGQYAQAVIHGRNAVELRPDFAIALNNLGNALQALGGGGGRGRGRGGVGGGVEEAMACYRKAIALQPGYAEAFNNLGYALQESGRLIEARAAFRQAHELKPQDPEICSNLGDVMKTLGEIDEAIDHQSRAVSLAPLNPSIHSNLLFTMNYSARLSEQAQFDEAKKWAERHEKPLLQQAQGFGHARDPGKRLKIGYVSADFRMHPVGFFLLPLLEKVDRSQVEIVAYSDVAIPDAMTRRLQESAGEWHSTVGMSDVAFAEMIRSHGIDILVDLGGHTARNRLPLFARRLAPVQVTYLGYPATTGLTAMDHRLTDAWADPIGQTESWHTESLWRLPVSAWCFASPTDAEGGEADVATERHSQRERQSGPIVFGCFNNYAKVSPSVIDLWRQILAKIPGDQARLLLKARGFNDLETRRHVQARLERLGLDMRRVDLVGWRDNRADHLASYGDVDVALDTYPYHGTTTTCEALWMGVPVVSLVGKSHVARVGVSLLTNAGVPDLIADSPDEYVNKATELARDRPRLAHYRQTLRAQMQSSALMDSPRFARDMEKAFRGMWRQWCAQSIAGETTP